MLYLRQHYYFGPGKIADYLKRFHGVSVATSSVHRILGKHGLNRLPAHQKHRAHATRWKRYEKAQPGHRLQLDVKFLERIPGTRTRRYQFTAIDDCTRIRVLKVYNACNQRRAIQFINEVRRRSPLADTFDATKLEWLPPSAELARLLFVKEHLPPQGGDYAGTNRGSCLPSGESGWIPVVVFFGIALWVQRR